MRYRKYNRFRKFIRNKILLPIANRLIGRKMLFVHVTYKGIRYEARYHRFHYWYDNEPITIRGIFEKRKNYHVSYWDGGETGRCWCEMFGWGERILHVKRGENIEYLVDEQLSHVIAMWLEYVVKPNKEKNDA